MKKLIPEELKGKKVVLYARSYPPEDIMDGERKLSDIAPTEKSLPIPDDLESLGPTLTELWKGALQTGEYKKCLCFGVYGIFTGKDGKEHVTDNGARISEGKRDEMHELALAFSLAKHFLDHAKAEEKRWRKRTGRQ